MTAIDVVKKLLVIATSVGQVELIAAAVYYTVFRKKYPAIAAFMVRRGLMMAFIVSLVATLGSLFYSEVVGFDPCKLCWFQRIFMYPLPILFAWALVKEEKNHIIDYALWLSGVGFVFSLYHNVIFYAGRGLNIPCEVGGSVSCVKQYVFSMGYITIPLMALTAFLMIIALLMVQKSSSKKA